VWFGLGIVVFGIATLVAGPRMSIVENGSSFDFDLNWIAARRLVDGESLYDRVSSRAEAVHAIGPWMKQSGRDPFSSYIGPPATALLHTPFLLFERDTSASVFGFVTVVGLALAVVITARALPRHSRLVASLVGLGVLLVSFPALRTLELGQGNELVMLGFAVGVFGVARRRWGLAGVGLGVASVLKVSPIVLVVYLVLRGQWRAARSAFLTALALLGVAAAVGRPGDLVVWVRNVAPSVASGPIHVYNQSLVAWLGRLVAEPRLFGTHTDLGSVYLLAYVVTALGTLGLWYARRWSALAPLELGVLVLLLLLAGPLSWDHYFVWAVIPITLVADLDLWVGRSRGEVVALLSALAAAVLLLSQWVTVPAAPSNHLAWTVRVTSSPYTLASLILLGVASWLLAGRGCTDRSTGDREHLFDPLPEPVP
jgi:alpha-1,2-mannosyltransferase